MADSHRRKSLPTNQTTKTRRGGFCHNNPLPFMDFLGFAGFKTRIPLQTVIKLHELKTQELFEPKNCQRWVCPELLELVGKWQSAKKAGEENAFQSSSACSVQSYNDSVAWHPFLNPWYLPLSCGLRVGGGCRCSSRSSRSLAFPVWMFKLYTSA